MKRNKYFTATKVILATFFLVFVIIPLTFMLFYMRDVDVGALITSAQFKTGLKNSFLLASVATVVSISLALTLSFAVMRSNIKYKAIFSSIFTLPMLIPSISHGMGLIILFGANGMLTNLFNLSWNIYGFGGVLMGSVLYSFPVAYLMIHDVLQYEDYSPYEAGEVLGIPRSHHFWAITVPYLKKPMISVAFAVFTVVITDYGVPLMIGGKFSTLPVMMYQEVIGLLNFGKGSVIGTVLLVPAIIAFVADLLNKDKANMSFVNMKAKIRKHKLRDNAAYILCSLTCFFVLLPIALFCVVSLVKKYPSDMSFSFINIAKAFNMNAGRFLINSLVIALSASITGTFLSYVTAYISSRTRGRSSKLLHLFSITSMAIPGIVLGLSYVLFFKGSFLYGTIFILILINMIHFFSSPYLMAYNSFNKINGNLEAVGATLGISRFYIIKDVLVPQMADTILEMLSYFFVNCMITISAVSFVYTINTMPISLMITQFEAQMLLESSAFISVALLVINLIAKGLTTMIKTKIRES